MAWEAEPAFRPRGVAFHQSCEQLASSLGGAGHTPISQSAEAPSADVRNPLSVLQPTVVSSDGACVAKRLQLGRAGREAGVGQVSVEG